jgi:hypothetical protein
MSLETFLHPARPVHSLFKWTFRQVLCATLLMGTIAWAGSYSSTFDTMYYDDLGDTPVDELVNQGTVVGTGHWFSLSGSIYASDGQVGVLTDTIDARCEVFVRYTIRWTRTIPLESAPSTAQVYFDRGGESVVDVSTNANGFPFSIGLLGHAQPTNQSVNTSFISLSSPASGNYQDSESLAWYSSSHSVTLTQTSNPDVYEGTLDIAVGTLDVVGEANAPEFNFREIGGSGLGKLWFRITSIS